MPFAAVHESGDGTNKSWRGGLMTSAVEGRTDMPLKRGLTAADIRSTHQASDLDFHAKRAVPVLIQPLGIAVFDYTFNLLHRLR